MKMEKTEFTIEGRKVPLIEIRRKTLTDHAPYMRDNSNSYYDNMTSEDLIARLQELHEYMPEAGVDLQLLQEKLKNIERTRHFMVWHDNSTVANHGYLLCLVSVIYDPAVYLTNEEYKAKSGKIVDVQERVEKPSIHLIAQCGSSEA